MDYSKWKKICIILMIISLVLNICSKVFGAYEFKGTNEVTYQLPDAFANYKYVIVIIPTRSWDITMIYGSNTEFVATNNSTSSSFSIGFSSPNVPYAYVEKNLSGTNFSSQTVSTNTSSRILTDGISGITGTSTYRNIVATNFDLKKVNGSILFNNTNFSYPYISNPDSDINNLTFDRLYVEPADYGTSNNLFLHILQVTQVVENAGNDNIYYYSDDMIKLNKNSEYIKYFPDADYYYYSIPRSEFGFKVNTAYILVLSNNGDIINNSVGNIVVNNSNGIYDVVSVNSENSYTYNDMIGDNMDNIQNDLSSTNSTVEDDFITDSFDYNTENQQLTSNHSGFFSRLLNLFTNLYDYDLTSDTPIEIPLPHSDKKIILHSNIISSHIGEPLKTIISAFWLYVFYMYAWKFFNYIYIEIETGKILDNEDNSVPGAIHTDIL